MHTRFLVIGGGVAGAAAAAALAEHGGAILLEAESAFGYHATGRSAATYDETYGHPVINAATRASREFFWSPPPGFSDYPVVRPRAELLLAGPDQQPALDDVLARHPALRRVDADEIRRLCPILKPDVPWEGALDARTADLDVDAILQGFIRLARARGAQMMCNAKVVALERKTAGWRIESTAGRIDADIVVNAAGAWAGQVGLLAGLGDLGLQPLRRTAIRIEPSNREGLAEWPFVIDVEERFYFKPDAGGLLISPADETATDPCDAQPDELDVAYAVHNFEEVATEKVRRVAHRWAGLRTFAPDRVPIIGADPRAPQFFWLAGQGGYGIMTSPALAETCASLLTTGELPRALSSLGVSTSDLSPSRLLAGR